MKPSIIAITGFLLFCTACSNQDKPGGLQTEELLVDGQVNVLSPIEYHNQKATNRLFVIEREMPGVGRLTQEELRQASHQSNKVLEELGHEIRWIHSYVTDHKIYCVYSSPNEDLVRQHAVAAGFPANVISEAGTIIDPTTADQ
jgi:hypothetical protein